MTTAVTAAQTTTATDATTASTDATSSTSSTDTSSLEQSVATEVYGIISNLVLNEINNQQG